MVALFVPYHTLSNPAVKTEPYEQEFLITAYYSPLPHQSSYVKGGYKADKILNGEGHTAADGTGVYPGMIAAPPGYSFGTVVTLQGLGTFKVHDRGGAIKGNRIDIWAGHGEEGLARALAFGLQRVKGTVYPNGTSTLNVAFDLDSIPAPVDQLRNYFVERDNLLALRPKVGDRGLSVYLLQEHLQEIGYLKTRPTGFFGDTTSRAFRRFVADFHLNAPQDQLSEISAAFVLGAKQRLGARDPVDGFVDDKAAPQTVIDAQRILRFLGYYSGRTNGEYDENTKSAIFAFQKDHGLVGDWSSIGAGRIGPMTSRAMHDAWNRKVVASHADRYLDKHAIETTLADRGERIAHFLGEGYTGAQVKLLQNELAALGFFPEKMVNGVYGPLTMESVMRYQFDRGIITSRSDTGAGYVGPSTLHSLRKDQRNILYNLVRAEGWKSL
tara:strand:- start:424 stop:1743 length:1320 start_codon:yes stop_codon:yes gene_type:complete